MIKKVYYSLLILSLFFSTIGNAKSGRREVKKLKRTAELNFFNEDYEAALPIYLYLDSIGQTNANVNFKIGFCYLNSGYTKVNAIPYLEKAIQNTSPDYVEYTFKEDKAPQSSLSYLAKAYSLNYEFDKAIDMYNRYKELLGTNPAFENEIADIDRDISISQTAKKMVADSMNYRFRNLGSAINSEYAEFSPVLSLDEKMLIFTSKRPIFKDEEKDKKGMYVDNIFYSTFENFEWTKAKPIGAVINSKKNEASVNLSVDGQKLIIYRDDEGGGDLYVSEMGEEGWGEPKAMDANINTPHWETHACYSSDNNIVYFVSDRPGGFGKRDIYKCLRLPNGQWGPAQNLGPEINTEYDEEGVFIHPNGSEIFFSSKGHNTMGGFDIFSSRMDGENGFWSEPENMGYPINSPDDDVYFVVSPDGKRAYFTSAKEPSVGEKDLFMIDFRETMPEALTLLKGVVMLNGAPPSGKLPNVQITARNPDNDSLLQLVRPVASTGRYVLLLASGLYGKTYSISCTADGYKPISFVMSVPPDSSYYEIERSLNLQFINFESKPIDTIHLNYSGKEKLVASNGKDSVDSNGQVVFGEVEKADGNLVLEKGKKMKLTTFYFGVDKDVVSKEEKQKLENLYNTIVSNPTLKFEVQGHTDSTGKESYNVKLSIRRAEQIVGLLVSKGIKKENFVVKGFGSSMPSKPNTLTNGKPNIEGMKENRRVEIFVSSEESEK